MKTVLLGLVCALAAWGAGKPGGGGGGGTCTNPSLQWEILPTYIDGTQNAIQGDGSPYVGGQSGVNAYLDVCGGTNNARLNLDSSIRNVSVSYAKLLASTSITPDWARQGQTISCMNVCFGFNVRNLLHVPSGQNRANEYEFTTQMQGHNPLNTHNYMVNPQVDAVPAVTLKRDPVHGKNAPYLNSPVKLVHCPAQFTGSSDSGLCEGGRPEQWFVWPDSAPTATGTSQTGLPITQVLTLFIDGASNTMDNGGEFSIPFFFVITALQ
jgi:hypothetical protein